MRMKGQTEERARRIEEERKEDARRKGRQKGAEDGREKRKRAEGAEGQRIEKGEKFRT